VKANNSLAHASKIIRDCNSSLCVKVSCSFAISSSCLPLVIFANEYSRKCIWHPPSTTLDILHIPRDGTTISDLLRQHTMVLHSLKQNLRCTRQRMADQANQHCINRSFNVRDWVWVRLQPYRQQSVHRRSCPKLAPRYSGPYQILCRIGNVAYELQLPPTSKIHPIFHVSLLRPFKGKLSPLSATQFSTSKNTERHLPIIPHFNSNLTSQPNSLTPPILPTNHSLPRLHSPEVSKITHPPHYLDPINVITPHKSHALNASHPIPPNLLEPNTPITLHLT